MTSVTHEKFDVVLFDLVGVITATANIHACAWEQAFDELGICGRCFFVSHRATPL